MRVFVLGLDGATWDILRPLADAGELPNISRLMAGGASGTTRLGLSAPLAGGLDRDHDGEEFRASTESSSSWSTRTQSARRAGELVPGDQGRTRLGDRWEARQGDRGGGGSNELPPPQGPWPLPRRLPRTARCPRLCQSDPERCSKSSKPNSASLISPGRPPSTMGDAKAEALGELTHFLEQHLKAVSYLARRAAVGTSSCTTLWPPIGSSTNSGTPGNPLTMAAQRAATSRRSGPGSSSSGRRWTEGSARLSTSLPSDTAVLLISDHGFGPIEWYVNFNVWMLQAGRHRLARLVLRQAEEVVL